MADVPFAFLEIGDFAGSQHLVHQVQRVAHTVIAGAGVCGRGTDKNLDMGAYFAGGLEVVGLFPCGLYAPVKVPETSVPEVVGGHLGVLQGEARERQIHIGGRIER